MGIRPMHQAHPTKGNEVSQGREEQMRTSRVSVFRSEGRKYCGQYCHDARETIELSCNCGHCGCVSGEKEVAA